MICEVFSNVNPIPGLSGDRRPVKNILYHDDHEPREALEAFLSSLYDPSAAQDSLQDLNKTLKNFYGALLLFVIRTVTQSGMHYSTKGYEAGDEQVGYDFSYVSRSACLLYQPMLQKLQTRYFEDCDGQDPVNMASRAALIRSANLCLGTHTTIKERVTSFIDDFPSPT